MSTTEQLDVKLDKFRLVKHMNSPDDIRAIIVLKNGTVAFATLRTLYIYQKDNLFKPSLTISLDNSVYSLIELPDGSLVAATKGLLIWTISEYCDRAKLKGTIKSDNEIGEVLLLPGDRSTIQTYTFSNRPCPIVTLRFIKLKRAATQN